ncbi:hypothetical protein CWE08_06005 [Aliidiomarina iranensis]|uniref:Pilus assembly protein TadE n=1 Tax=Aliidiomarina iranensis TaxID=1434071 RepID=A0A432VWQ7_9GAMM|nr:TadE family protein [Aliidiomarina iranensis]RUO21144.1 hypothetical protein CWE08_06005 [Aliidiomarina iranensis]
MNAHRFLVKPMLGQSTVEGTITLGLFFLFLAALVQLIWLLLVQQMLQATTLSATRVGARSNMDKAAMQLLVQSRMQSIPGMELHLPKITRLAPSDGDIKQYGRFNKSTQEYRLPTEFPAVSLSLLGREEQERYLKLRVLQVEIIYCFPLQVPLAGAFINAIVETDAYCQTQPRRHPVMSIQTRATVPLENDLKI